MVTEEQAKTAAKKAFKELCPLFNKASKIPVNMVGVSKDADGFHLVVGLDRKVTAEEQKSFPMAFDNVLIKYQFIGPIIAA